jgi:hypothetical protein
VSAARTASPARPGATPSSGGNAPLVPGDDRQDGGPGGDLVAFAGAATTGSRAGQATTASTAARATTAPTDGLGVYAKRYAHQDDALRDLGVAHDALEPNTP